MNEQSLKDKLHIASKELGLPFNFCLRRLVLERFLVRLSLSAWKDKFIFKGGMLLAQYIEIGRETIDLDFLATKFNANEPEIRRAMRDISSILVEDGFTFQFTELSQRAHEHTNYPGFEAIFHAAFSKIKERFFIDIGIGDVVVPVDESIELLTAKQKPIFEDFISLIVYPIETIFSEKIHTMVARGARNSRMKDYHDAFLIINSGKLLDKKSVFESIQKTFLNRKEELKTTLLSFNDAELDLLQKLWSSFQNELQKTKKDVSVLVPAKIIDVITKINESLFNLKNLQEA